MTKRIGKRGILLFILAVLALLFSASCSAENENLLYNGDFEILDADGQPEGWFTDAYRMETGYSVFSVTEGINGADSSAVMIRNAAKNDARYAQTVQVEPETMYCLSGYIRAEEITFGHGANLSIEGIYAFSEKLYDTEGEWQKIEYYGETGPAQHEITVFARIGGYSGESKGSASFDQLSLTKAETVPDGVFADLWYEPDVYGEDEEEWDTEDGENEGSTTDYTRFFLILIAAMYAGILIAAVWYFRDGKRTAETPLRNSSGWIWPVLLAALGIRIALSSLIEGYSVDVNCFMSWGATMLRTGPAEFYQSTGFCDYPPLYMYITGLNSWIAGLAGAGAGWTRVIFRMIPCVCDVAGCMLILRYTETKQISTGYSKAVLLLLAFNPVTIINSAAWGQMDSVLCLLLLAVAAWAVEGKWIHALAAYVTAVLVKPQALMLGFLGLAFLIITAIRKKEERKKLLIGIAAGTVLIFLYILPFGLKQQPGWLISLYGNTLSSYPYATVNTANLYYITGGNWSAVANKANIAAPVFLAAACAVHGTVWTLRNRNRKAFLAETILAGLFVLWFVFCACSGKSWAWTGIGAMAYAFVIVLSLAVRKAEIRFLPYLGALLFILLYVFGIKMHERYLFPAFLLLAFAWVLQKDRRILWLIALFSATVFINEGIVLDNSIRLGATLGHLNADTVIMADILSVLNVTGALWAVFIGYDAALPVRIIDTPRRAKEYRTEKRLFWKRKDTLILCCITLLYSIVSLSTLGSTKAPQTAWTSSSEEEQIVFDLQEEQDDIRILYFGQVSREEFTVSQSSDGINWSEEVTAQMDQGQCWKWKYVTQFYYDAKGRKAYYNTPEYTIHFSGRYIRLSACQVGLTLNEVIFRDASGNTIQASVADRSGYLEDSVLYSDPEHLLDEQDTMENLPGIFMQEQDGETQPSWWNSTYFDEIYHARTGYEFTQGSVPYETSHPPLGKVLISWFIMIFGMTPFGWRFAGALAGILMLPGIYLLTKQLTKKTWPSAFACGLMALDCMHLTQTQIATIDSFPVLFIIFAYCFMLRFIQTDLRRSGIRSALIPLACSGLFMGLSIASKWIGVYAGIGLAVLYFWHCIRQVWLDREENRRDPEYTGTEKPEINPEKEDHSDGKGMPAGSSGVFRKVMILSFWCVLFFVILPLMIYLLSYIPYMAYNTRISSIADYLKEVWRSQVGMFNYHSTPGLGMDHPFYSPWWQWPIIGKPMYYATEQYIPAEAVLHHSIFSFGNPAVWWGSICALCIIVCFWLREKRYQIGENDWRWHVYSHSWDTRYEFVLISFLAQYLPWVLVPRGTYIYHYFASIPFLILMISMCFNADHPVLYKLLKIIGSIFLLVSLVLFIILLPYATGMAAPASWLDIGKKILRIWY